jgi:hypothetical protein
VEFTSLFKNNYLQTVFNGGHADPPPNALFPSVQKLHRRRALARFHNHSSIPPAIRLFLREIVQHAQGGVCVVVHYLEIKYSLGGFNINETSTPAPSIPPQVNNASTVVSWQQSSRGSSCPAGSCCARSRRSLPMPRSLSHRLALAPEEPRANEPNRAERFGENFISKTQPACRSHMSVDCS